jgi:hypothetical protein
MLGLGNKLTNSATVFDDSVFVFRKNLFAANDFEDYSVEGGALTFTANQSAPDGSTGWLKVVYPGTDQTNLSGIQNTNTTSEFFLQPYSDLSTPRQGSTFTLKFDIYLEGTDEWGTDDVTTTGLVAGYGVNQNIPVNAATTLEKTSANLLDSTATVDLKIYWPLSGDRPLGGATFYIKNLSIKINP